METINCENIKLHLFDSSSVYTNVRSLSYSDLFVNDNLGSGKYIMLNMNDSIESDEWIRVCVHCTWPSQRYAPRELCMRECFCYPETDCFHRNECFQFPPLATDYITVKWIDIGRFACMRVHFSTFVLPLLYFRFHLNFIFYSCMWRPFFAHVCRKNRKFIHRK